MERIRQKIKKRIKQKQLFQKKKIKKKQLPQKKIKKKTRQRLKKKKLKSLPKPLICCLKKRASI
ncbi:hypothetical protein HP10700_08621 [Helicobacter pylori 10700]|nr:hypothetical protein HP10700_08621 [Helicobacter pylori 10700]